MFLILQKSMFAASRVLLILTRLLERSGMIIVIVKCIFVEIGTAGGVMLNLIKLRSV